MSQYPAAQRRTIRRPAHALQHTAIVFAGMTSIGLTVIAGTYVVNQIADSNHLPIAERPASHAGMPTGTPQSAPADHTHHIAAGTLDDGADTGGNGEFPRDTVQTENVMLAADSSPLPIAPPRVADRLLPPTGETPLAPPATATSAQFGHVDPPTVPLDATTEGADIGGRADLPADGHVGANVTAGPQNSVSTAVDTNALTAFDDRAQAAQSGGTPDPTRLRTDLDTDSGAVTVTVSDPATGAPELHTPNRAGPAIAAKPPAPEEIPAIARSATPNSTPTSSDSGEVA